MNLVKTSVAALAFAGSAAFAADYQIDVGHSSVNFTAGHLGFAYTAGRFNEFEGAFSDTAGSESVSVTIDASSIDTNHDERDQHLRSPDFFDVRQYPEITFQSTSFDGETLVGELTMHGKTGTVELDVELVGEGEDPWGGYRKGFVASGTLLRSEWDITYFLPAVPDEIEMVIHVEGIRQ